MEKERAAPSWRKGRVVSGGAKSRETAGRTHEELPATRAFIFCAQILHGHRTAKEFVHVSWVESERGSRGSNALVHRGNRVKRIEVQVLVRVAAQG